MSKCDNDIEKDYDAHISWPAECSHNGKEILTDILSLCDDVKIPSILKVKCRNTFMAQNCSDKLQKMKFDGKHLKITNAPKDLLRRILNFKFSTLNEREMIKNYFKAWGVDVIMYCKDQCHLVSFFTAEEANEAEKKTIEIESANYKLEPFYEPLQSSDVRLVIPLRKRIVIADSTRLKKHQTQKFFSAAAIEQHYHKGFPTSNHTLIFRSEVKEFAAQKKEFFEYVEKSDRFIYRIEPALLESCLEVRLHPLRRTISFANSTEARRKMVKEYFLAAAIVSRDLRVPPNVPEEHYLQFRTENDARAVEVKSIELDDRDVFLQQFTYSCPPNATPHRTMRLINIPQTTEENVAIVQKHYEAACVQRLGEDNSILTFESEEEAEKAELNPLEMDGRAILLQQQFTISEADKIRENSTSLYKKMENPNFDYSNFDYKEVNDEYDKLDDDDSNEDEEVEQVDSDDSDSDDIQEIDSSGEEIVQNGVGSSSEEEVEIGSENEGEEEEDENEVVELHSSSDEE